MDMSSLARAGASGLLGGAFGAVAKPCTSSMTRTNRKTNGCNAAQLAERFLTLKMKPRKTMTKCPECGDTGQRDSGGSYPWGETVYLPCDCKDAEIGRQWREDSSLEKWFPLTAERLARLEQWARDCRDQVLFQAAQQENAIGKAADSLGQGLVEFHLGPNAEVTGGPLAARPVD